MESETLACRSREQMLSLMKLEPQFMAACPCAKRDLVEVALAIGPEGCTSRVSTQMKLGLLDRENVYLSGMVAFMSWVSRCSANRGSQWIAASCGKSGLVAPRVGKSGSAAPG